MTWKTIGTIGVDAGLCWVGDPCYILGGDRPKSIGKDWPEFCDLLGGEYPTQKSFSYDMGHEGLGVCFSTGYGDGSYPVKAKFEDGRIKEIKIKFF